MVMDLVNRDIDRVKRAMGVTPYRWRIVFITTEEIAEREQAFGSAARAFYNVQDFLMSRVQKKTSDTFDMVEVNIWDSRLRVPVSQVNRRPIGPGNRRPIGYWVAEHLGYEV